MEMQEKFGYVKVLRSEHGFGFINSNNADYYFKISQAKNQIRIGDPVAFLLVKKNDKFEATSIRRVFTNAHSIRIISRAKSHQHDGVEEYLTYIMNEIKDYNEEFLVKQIDLPKPIGMCSCVRTNEDDDVYFAIRKGRLGHSRFVLNRQPEPTNSIVLVLKRIEHYYSIITSYLGVISGVEPYDTRATKDDLAYWSRHAFIDGSEEIIESSKVFVNPWILQMPAICPVRVVTPLTLL